MKIEEQDSTKMKRSTDTILENLLDAVLVVDKRGYILYANRAAQELFSLSVSELKGHAFGYPVLPHDIQEIEVFKEAQPLTVQMLASNIHWEGQLASLLSLRDITAQKEVQRDLNQQKKILEKTNEENAQYASLASHDLKEPIRKILFFSDHLLSGGQLRDNEKTYVEKIQSSAKRMHALIASISELSNITHVRQSFDNVNLNQVIAEVVSDLELQFQDTGAIIEISELPSIDAIADEMYQLFLNLISNALKYSREGETPHIEIRERPSEDGFVCVECVDNGIGFDNEMSSKLFRPFQRLHSKKSDGMGIGLTLCQRIVEVHHGQISAKGVPGKGASFTIQLPRNQLSEG